MTSSPPAPADLVERLADTYEHAVTRAVDRGETDSRAIRLEAFRAVLAEMANSDESRIDGLMRELIAARATIATLAARVRELEEELEAIAFKTRDDRHIAELATAREQHRAELAAIPMYLTCPKCSARHIDEGEFATKVHHTHSCQQCGLTWRPAVVPTVGVWFLPGFKNQEGSRS